MAASVEYNNESLNRSLAKPHPLQDFLHDAILTGTIMCVVAIIIVYIIITLCVYAQQG